MDRLSCSGRGSPSPPPSSLTAMAETPDISDRKLLKHGVGPEDEGEGILSGLSDISREEFTECLGLSRPLSTDSDAPEPPSAERVSDFLFLLRRKFPLSNIFSQLGSSVQ